MPSFVPCAGDIIKAQGDDSSRLETDRVLLWRVRLLCVLALVVSDKGWVGNFVVIVSTRGGNQSLLQNVFHHS